MTASYRNVARHRSRKLLPVILASWAGVQKLPRNCSQVDEQFPGGVRFGPNWVDSGRFGPVSGRFGPIWANWASIGPTADNTGQMLLDLGRLWPRLSQMHTYGQDLSCFWLVVAKTYPLPRFVSFLPCCLGPSVPLASFLPPSLVPLVLSQGRRRPDSRSPSFDIVPIRRCSHAARASPACRPRVARSCVRWRS